MTDSSVDVKRRKMLTVATSSVGAVGAAFAMVPLISSMGPSARAKAAGAPVEIDISDLKPGQMLVQEWRGKPVWVVRRTPAMLASLKTVEGSLADPASDTIDQQPAYAQNAHRSIKEGVLVVLGICTHLGCAPSEKFATGEASGVSADWAGGFYCPCHGSKFDLAGRVFLNVPAPTNLVVPPHKYLDDNKILIGEDQEVA